MCIAASPSTAAPEAKAGAAADLHALFDEDWEHRLEEDPVSASYLGDRRWNDRWPDISREALERAHDRRKQMLARIRGIDRTTLSPVDVISYDLFVRAKQRAIDEHNYRWYLVVLNQRGGIQTADELADAIPFETVKDYEDWLARLRSLPTYVKQTQALMGDGIQFKMLLPKEIMQRVPAQIENQIVEQPDDSPFFKPFREFPSRYPCGRTRAPLDGRP